MNTKSSEARNSMLENQVAVLTSMIENNFYAMNTKSSEARNSMLENQVAVLTSMIENNFYAMNTKSSEARNSMLENQVAVLTSMIENNFYAMNTKSSEARNSMLENQVAVLTSMIENNFYAMNTKSSEARNSMLENQVAVLTSMREKNSNVREEELRVRISKLESKVAKQTSMIEALINHTNYRQVDVANLKSSKRKFDLGRVSQAKKRKLYSDSTFTGEVSECSEAVKVYTGASCLYNGKYKSSAVIRVYWGPDSEDNVSQIFPRRNTHKAEIYAAIIATEQAIKKNIKDLIIHTDSKFLINCITKRIHTWEKNGWLKSDGGKVLNKKELQELDYLLKNINVKWVHVNGSIGIPGNEAADKLAVKGAGCKKKPNINVQKFLKKQRKSKRAKRKSSEIELTSVKFPKAVQVYTDGSCLYNGKYNASAGIGVYWGPDSEDNVSEKLSGRQTHHRAEICAAIKAIEQAIKKNIKDLIIHTDSMFLIHYITNWKKIGGKVIDKEELQELDALLKNINVKWVHVNGHSGIPGNEAADQLAVKGAECKKKPNKNAHKKQRKSKRAKRKSSEICFDVISLL